VQEAPHRGLDLLLELVLTIIVVGYHSLEKREFRDGESDRLDERERTVLQHFIAAVGGIFEGTPGYWGMVLQIHSSNGPKIHTHSYIG
jgi:hypothetical protein